MIDQSKIRNFCIIAHIDHGKSTLADRIIEMTGFLPRGKCRPRFWITWTLRENEESPSNPRRFVLYTKQGRK